MRREQLLRADRSPRTDPAPKTVQPVLSLVLPIIAPPRPEALSVYHGFVASVLNYNSNQPKANS